MLNRDVFLFLIRPFPPPLLILDILFFFTRLDGGLLAPVRTDDARGEDLLGLLQPGKGGTTALVVHWNEMPWGLGMHGLYLVLARSEDWSLKNDS